MGTQNTTMAASVSHPTHPAQRRLNGWKHEGKKRKRQMLIRRAHWNQYHRVPVMQNASRCTLSSQALCDSDLHTRASHSNKYLHSRDLSRRMRRSRHLCYVRDTPVEPFPVRPCAPFHSTSEYMERYYSQMPEEKATELADDIEIWFYDTEGEDAAANETDAIVMACAMVSRHSCMIQSDIQRLFAVMPPASEPQSCRRQANSSPEGSGPNSGVRKPQTPKAEHV